MRRRRAAAFFVLLLCASWFPPSASAAPVEAPPPLFTGADAVPVPRPGAKNPRTVPIGPFLQAEAEYAAGRREDALNRFLDLAYTAPDEERKGFVWMRVGEILLSRGELDKALEAADKAVLLSRARYLTLSAVDLKLRIYQRMRWTTEARQMAAYLLDQKYVDANVPALLALMARAEAEPGRLGAALSQYRRAIAAAAPQDAARLSAERDALVDRTTDILVLREAGEAEEDPDVRSHLFLAMGRIATRKGFLGMSSYAFDRAARTGGKWAREAAESLFRAEKIASQRPAVAGIVPLSGKLSEIGFSVLCGAEVALATLRRHETDPGVPVIRWLDTAGQPEKARKEFTAAAADRTVIGVLGPVTGDEGRSVATAFTAKSPPTLYLGQKQILEKPFLYGFGLSPAQEAAAVLSRLSRDGIADLFLFYPDNGYGKGFAEAVAAAAKGAGVRVSKSVSYPSDAKDFTDVIRKAVGGATFQQESRSKEKGKAMKLRQGGIVIADRWDRVFLLASQLRYYNVYLPLAGFSGWNDPELLRKAGPAVAGAVFSADYSDAIPGSPGDRLRKEFQEVMRSPPTRFEAMGYDGALLLAEALALGNGAGNPTPEGMRERIARLKNFSGATGTFQFTPSGELRRKVTLLKVELGNFVPVLE